MSPKPRKPKPLSDPFLTLCRQQGLPVPTPEYPAIPGRKFRCDFAWIPERVSLEVQGGVWSGGKHGRGSGIVRDHEKANLLAVNGWRCLYVQPRHLLNLDTIRMVRAALETTP